jgi:hypothetical protein
MTQDPRRLGMFTNKDLIEELMLRGVLRQYQTNTIVPGPVIRHSQQSAEQVQRAAMGKLVGDLIRSAMMNGIIALGSQHEEEDDTYTFSAAIMTLDPVTRMDDTAHGPLYSDTPTSGGDAV